MNITLPCNILIDEILLNQTHRAIHPLMGELIAGLFLQKSTVYVQFETCDDWRAQHPKIRPLERPILWRWEAWIESSEKYNNIRTYEHKRRVAQWIFEANVKTVKRYAIIYLSVDDNWGNMIAWKMVERKMDKQIKALGVEKLITKEEEL